ncbi:ergothioneine biosynthesis glutamate--cysteine ligase EgtA [Streptomyces beijiangensis]|uniref:Glutamate--cysteine ligase EgtA n=1 Tax=Streptomyces beijiangensis TaxID=163361 RepID=A0A939JHF8_9ACTN|nr:ergothioneine biosynthesis glutamate--cysteine ligase EgtA [Streptomyces beijiangensis]MBO0516196.1 ergothioneine biosynthesis glutamate--cysteine ligase EgtA [Streptomyces beijiangensis]
MPFDLRPTTEDTLTPYGAEDHIRGVCFKNGPPRRIGVELEWLLLDLGDPARPVSPLRSAEAASAIRALPLRSALTFEPGGQLELSSPPADSLTECVETVAADLELVRDRLRPHGLGLAGHGLNPWHPPLRVLDVPRYAAMERHFDRTGRAGRYMMCSSAAVQVCLDAGSQEPGPLGQDRRWQLARLLGPVLVAAFANSPLLNGVPTGLRSNRQAVWTALDAGRAPVRRDGWAPAAEWAAHALDSQVMFVRTDDAPWSAPEGFTFRDWIRGGAPRPPTTPDLDYHLTTLFPPVRPHGHLELRMIDAQSGDDGWLVPLAVCSALFDDPRATESAFRAVRPLAVRAGAAPAPRNPLWRAAARHGLTDPGLRTAAEHCFIAALEALPRRGASAHVIDTVAEFTARYVLRGRTPADDVLDSWKEHRA